MRFAYADPPYFGYAVQFYGGLHPEAAIYDTLEGHRALIEKLCDEFKDGWALSMTSGNLKDILPLCPRDVRITAWVKPFASFKKHVGVAYAWEPVVLFGGRRRTLEMQTIRDWFAENITLKRGFTGAKPARVIHWVMEMLGYQEGDELIDIFHGSGSVKAAIEQWHNNPRLFA